MAKQKNRKHHSKPHGGGVSYREFVAQCEEYVNERHGQCSLWEVTG